MMLVSEDGDVERDQCFLRVAGERWRGAATDERNCLGYINEGAGWPYSMPQQRYDSRPNEPQSNEGKNSQPNSLLLLHKQE